MKMKLAIFLGLLLLLPVAHMFGDDLQVKANKVANSDQVNKGNSLNNNEVELVEGNRNQVGKSDSGVKKNPKKGQNTQNSGGSEIPKKKTETKKVGDNLNGGIEKVKNEVIHSDNVDGLKKSLESNDDSSQNGVAKDYDSEAVNDGSEHNLDGDIKPKENNENQGSKDQGVELKKKGDSEEENSNNNNNVAGEKESKDGTVNEGDGNDSNSIGDECYSSVMCSDKENKLIACLRVPGSESQLLSLLIRNKDKKSLTVQISAPDFVKLESTKVQLQVKESKKVDVSIGNGGKESLIVLTSGDHICNLDFKDLMATSRSYKYLTWRPTLVFLLFSVLVIVALGWTILGLLKRRKLSSRGVFAYQKVDTGLPVTTVPKQRTRDNDGWDEGWGDDWDDEEAPRTPSKPSPSFSAKRLASRRLIKEARKD